jgi:protein-tyrosine-phosphatase
LEQPTPQKLRVLFLCTGNAARSQMAEALLRHLSKGRVDVFSAGSAPQATIHPAARATLERHYAIDAAGLRTKPMKDFLGQRFDFVITVCDKVAEACPVFPGDPERIHWSFEDPTALDDADAQTRAFEHIATGLAARLRIWMSLPEIRNRLNAHSDG